jgi:hypothetical protein
VWNQRYHDHPLATPSEVRLGLVYVLLNFRKHLRASPGIDPRSSGPWFEGWTTAPSTAAQPSPVSSPRTWLALIGWRRVGGAIDPAEAPAGTNVTARARGIIKPRRADDGGRTATKS